MCNQLCNSAAASECIFLSVQCHMTAPPRFTMTPDDVVYVSLGDPIILSCLAEGTPVPEILWYRDSELVHTTASLVVANDGTELRISSIRQDDIGDYTCTAKNGQGSVRHTTKLVVAGNWHFLIFLYSLNVIFYVQYST